MDIRAYWRLLRERWRLFLACVLLGLGVAAAATALSAAEYNASVTLFVSARDGQVSSLGDAYQGTLYTQSRIKSYASLVTNPRVTEPVAAEVGGGVSAGQLASNTTVSTSPDTVLIDIAVTDTSPQRAAALVNALGRQVASEVNRLETPPSGPPPVEVTLLHDATVPTTPVSPKPTKNLAFGLIAGLSLGFVTALVRQQLDKSIKEPVQLSTAAEVAVVGTLPYEEDRRPAVPDSRSASLEALRQLRTNLRFLGRATDTRCLAITSATAAEGKTSTAVNLAIVMAAAGETVVLVDADLRRPRIASILGLEGAVGLSDVLLGDVTSADALQEWGQGLYVLPSGQSPPNPTELLGLEDMHRLVQELRRLADVVVIDTPPVLPVADATVVGGLADAVVLVARHGRVTTDEVRMACTTLRQSGARLVGSVLNSVPLKASHYGYDYSGPSSASRPRLIKNSPSA